MDSGGKLKQELRQSLHDPGQAATKSLHETDLALQDLTLVQRLILREESAWHEFVTSYDRLIQQRSRATCTEVGMPPGQSDMAAEISAEVYATLVARDMESLKQFSGRSRISTWLFVVVRRIALRHLARLRRLPASTELDLCDLVPELPGQEIEQTEKLAAGKIRDFHSARRTVYDLQSIGQSDPGSHRPASGAESRNGLCGHADHTAVFGVIGRGIGF